MATSTHDSPIKQPVFYILCGNAAHNRGDRGNLYSQLALLKRYFPDATLVVDSTRPETDRKWYDAIVLRRSMAPNRQQREWLRKADLVICGGGALLADNSCRLLVPYWLLYLGYVKYWLRKPLMIWAHGLVLETALGRMLARHALNMADRITVRDSGSFALCQALKITPPYEQTADPAILLSPGSQQEGETILQAEGIPMDRPIFCISPTFWHLYHDSRSWLPYPMGKRFSLTLRRNQATLERYKQGVARLASVLAGRHNARILLMPRYASPEWDDVAYCREISEKANLPGRIHILDNDSYPPEQFFALWKCFDLNISVALHDAMFAMVMDCPVLHLYYESKGHDFFASIHAPEQLMDWHALLEDNGPEGIADQAAAIIAQWHDRKKQRDSAVYALKVRATRNAEILKEFHESLAH